MKTLLVAVVLSALAAFAPYATALASVNWH